MTEPEQAVSGRAIAELAEPTIFDHLVRTAHGDVCLANLDGTVTVSVDWLRDFARLCAKQGAGWSDPDD